MPAPVAMHPHASASAPAFRTRGAGAGRAPEGTPDDPALKKACNEMEALFIQQLLGEMRKTVEKSGLIDGGRSEEIYTTLMDGELAKEMARSGAMGLASMLYRSLGGGTAPGAIPPPRK